MGFFNKNKGYEEFCEINKRNVVRIDRYDSSAKLVSFTKPDGTSMNVDVEKFINVVTTNHMYVSNPSAIKDYFTTKDERPLDEKDLLKNRVFSIIYNAFGDDAKRTKNSIAVYGWYWEKGGRVISKAVMRPLGVKTAQQGVMVNVARCVIFNVNNEGNLIADTYIYERDVYENCEDYYRDESCGTVKITNLDNIVPFINAALDTNTPRGHRVG